MKILLLTISLFLFGLSFSQTTFSVITHDGLPAEKVMVYKYGILLGLTDSAGKFKVDNLLKGERVVFQLNGSSQTFLSPTNNPKSVPTISIDNSDNNSVNDIEEDFLPPAFERDRTASQPIDNKFYMNVDEVAEFPGGRAAMESFLDANIKNPDPTIEGICFLRFVVIEDGSRIITIITLGVPNCPECDKEALRVVKMMPKWEAGKIGGKKVKSYVDLPIYFKL